MGDGTWEPCGSPEEVDNGEWEPCGSPKEVEQTVFAHYQAQKPPKDINFDCRTYQGSRNLWKRTFVMERIDTYNDTTDVKRWAELYLQVI